jgi:FkbM family methyltransferase
MIERIRTLRRYWKAGRSLGRLDPALFPFRAGPIWHRDYVNGFVLKLAEFPIPRTAKCIVDIGANVGLFSKAAELYCPDARIYAVEPSQQAYAELRARCGNRVEAFRAAVGATEGEATLHLATQLASSTLQPPSLETAELFGGKLMPTGNTEVVPIITLDKLRREHNLTAIDLLKIDVEGFEPEVVEGGLETIAHHVDRVMLEVSFARLGSEKAMALLQSFFQLGFTLAHVTDVHRMTELQAAPVAQIDVYFTHSRLAVT